MALQRHWLEAPRPAPCVDGSAVGVGQQLEVCAVGQRPIAATPGPVVGAPLGEPGSSQDRLRREVVAVGVRVQPDEPEPATFDRRERVRDDRPERLAEGATPSGARPQPVAELALETTLRRSHPEDLDVAEHDVGCRVGDAPVQVLPGAHLPASSCQPGREVTWSGLGAGGHESQAVAIRPLTGSGGVRVSPWAQAQPGCLKHLRVPGGVRRRARRHVCGSSGAFGGDDAFRSHGWFWRYGGFWRHRVFLRHGVFRGRSGRVGHHRLA